MATLVVLAALVAACTVPSGFKHIDPSYTGVRVTADGGSGTASDGYDLTAQGGSPLAQVDLSADATVSSGNLRTSFFPAGQAPMTNGDVCATWAGPNTPDDLPQQGLAFRVQTNATGVRHAITVTKNIFAAPGWTVQRAVQQLNVNLWMVTQKAGQPDVTHLQNIGLDFSGLLGTDTTVVPFPWQVCARVGGPYVVVDVTTANNPHTPFADPSSFRVAVLPGGWQLPGQFGWYIGHLHGGQSFTYTDLHAGPST